MLFRFIQLIFSGMPSSKERVLINEPSFTLVVHLVDGPLPDLNYDFYPKVAGWAEAKDIY